MGPLCIIKGSLDFDAFEEIVPGENYYNFEDDFTDMVPFLFLLEPFSFEVLKIVEIQEKFINLRRPAIFFFETDGVDKYYSLQKWRHSFYLELF